MIEIDGSFGEGGGQILRTALSLAACRREPLRIFNIRSGRRKPGLARQHLTAVQAAAAVCGAEVKGVSLGSQEIGFRPEDIRPGDYRFSVGSAGSATLVLQTVLPPLLCAPGPSRLTLEGGTHNPWAPPFDFLKLAFLPLIERMGPRVRAKLERAGFHPAGGGCFKVEIQPVESLRPLHLTERGRVKRQSARVLIANLPLHIAEREIRVLASRLGWRRELLRIEPVPDPAGPGNVVLIEIECEHVTEVFCAFGRRGMKAEKVAAQAAGQAQRYLESGAPVGEHLSDQLLLPLALAGEGSLVTPALSRHAETNIDVIRRFLDVRMVTDRIDLDGRSAWRVVAT
jgi:RNA 3'-terminal phosphate cyclase (ATP)